MAEARPTVADLRDLISLPGPNNDLIDLTAKQPRLAQLTATVFPRAIRTLDRAQPVVEYARGYTPDLTGWITKFAEAAGYYDANGHYARVARVQPVELQPGGQYAHGDPADQPARPVRAGPAQPLSRRLHPALPRRLAALRVHGL